MKKKTKFADVANLVSMATLILSIIVAFQTCSRDKEDLNIKKEEVTQIKLQNTLESKLKLMTFYFDNYDKFYSKDISVRKNMALVLETLPRDVSDDFYKKIINSTNDDIFKHSFDKVKKAGEMKQKGSHGNIDDQKQNEAVSPSLNKEERPFFTLNLKKGGKQMSFTEVTFMINDSAYSIKTDNNGNSDKIYFDKWPNERIDFYVNGRKNSQPLTGKVELIYK